MANNARMVDTNLLIQAGIDPKTGLPIKLTEEIECHIKEDIRRALRVRDEQDAVNRYKWYNIPCDISSQELERLLYYKGQVCFFYYEQLDKFYFMPYALDGTIDFYGRYNTIHPIPMTGGTTAAEKAAVANQKMALRMLRLNVKYDVPINPLTIEDLTTSAVILGDYTNQLSQSIIPRQEINDPLLGVMSECIPIMRTALKNSSGVQAMRVGNQDESSNVIAANRAIDRATESGQRYIPIISTLDLQDLAPGATSKAQEYLMAMEALDNFRLSLYGIRNGGMFDKKAYVNNAETSLNAGNEDAPLIDGLTRRQRFCDIVNGIWGVGISCELDESIANADVNMDGTISSSIDQSGETGDQKQQEDIDE